uniref:Metalloendopeptidase n=1 Tax=Parastrongyloides trichosuri TaxID=131310 RepID=A0A0N5A6I8_PARTI
MIILFYLFTIFSINIHSKGVIKFPKEVGKFQNWTNPIHFNCPPIICKAVDKAIEEIEKHTCLKFKDQRNKLHNQEGIQFIWGNHDKHCGTNHVGYINSTTPVTVFLGSDCLRIIPKVQSIIHIALGVIPEHRRPDRDKFLIMQDQNIRPSGKTFYEIINSSQPYLKEVDYDYGVITHANRWEYIHWKDPAFYSTTFKHYYQHIMGQKEVTTFNDYKILNIMFCTETCTHEERDKLKCLNNGYTSPKNCNKCVCPFGYFGRRCQFIEIGKVRDYFRTIECQPEKLIATIESAKRILYGEKSCFIEIRSQLKLVHVCLNILKINSFRADVCRSGRSIEVKYRKDKGAMGLCFCNQHTKPIYIISEGDSILIHYMGNGPWYRLEFEYEMCMHRYLSNQLPEYQ